MTIPNGIKTKPEKPFPEYPLYPHNNGQWVRRIRGKIHSFGKWENPQAALEKHKAEYPYLVADIVPPGKLGGLTVKGLCDRFLSCKEDEQLAGQITDRWLDDLKAVGLWIANQFGRERLVESLGPADFQKARIAIVGKFSPTIARNYVSRIKTFFKFAYDNRLIEKPVHYGPQFKPPARAILRKHRALAGPKVWEPAQVRKMLTKANPTLKCMILLGINCGVNPSDLSHMPIKAINLKTGWMDYPRHKTWIARKVKLWPETIEAVKAVIADRVEPYRKDHQGLLFITSQRQQWSSSAIGHEFEKVLVKCKITEGTFIWFRKTVQTIGENSGDLVAVKLVMGHVDGSMSDAYREQVDPKRVLKVTDHLRTWLFGKGKVAK